MKARWVSTIVGGLAVGLALFSSAYAGTQTFFTPPGAKDSAGEPVSASATFNVTAGQIEIILTNLQIGIKSAGQLLSDLFFMAGGVTTGGTGNITPSASYIDIARDGSSTVNNTFTRSWKLTNTGGVYHLDGLANGSNTPHGLIIGPGPYTTVNPSIGGNRPHNPFAQGSATFEIAIAGLSADTKITNVVFSFGTEPGDNVPVPIPAAVWLFGSALLGLIGISRRSRAGIAGVSAATA